MRTTEYTEYTEKTFMEKNKMRRVERVGSRTGMVNIVK